MLLRPLLLQDLSAVAALDRLCFPPGIAFPEETFHQCLAAAECLNLGIEQSGELIAFAIFCFRDARSAQVITIDVHPERRRQGLADRLMTELESQARKTGLSRVALQVGVDNLPARNLYRKWGYRVRARLENYYGPGQDAYLMDKSF